MSKVRLAPDAENDLAEIWFYIAEDSSERADKFIEMLDAKFELLATHPEMGKARPELLAGIRSFPINSYVVFYRPIKDGVQILRVLNGARDIEAIF